MDAKPVLTSKTVGVNLVAVIAIFLQHKYGYVMDAELQGIILVLINLILRFVTKKAISFKKDDTRILSVLIVGFALMFSACGAKQSYVCMNVPEGQTSAICKISEKMNTTPEQISQILQVANFAALEADTYPADKALEFIDAVISEIEEFRKTGSVITYGQAIDYLNTKFNILPPRAQVAFSIINPGNLAQHEISFPLSDYDLSLILMHLEKQELIIKAYTN